MKSSILQHAAHEPLIVVSRLTLDIVMLSLTNTVCAFHNASLQISSAALSAGCLWVEMRVSTVSTVEECFSAFSLSP